MLVKLNLRFFLFILLVVILSYSCNKSLNSDNAISLETLHVDPVSAKSLSVKRIYIDEKRIPLTTSDSLLIDMISRFQVSKNRFYFLTFNHRVFSFSKDGKFKYIIDKQGKGPTEYVFPISLYAEPNDRYLEIFNRGSKNVVVVDSMGNYIFDWKYDLYISKATHYKGLTCMLVGSVLNFIDNEECTSQLFIYDSLKQMQASYIPFDKKYWKFLGVGDRIDMVHVNNNLHVRVNYNDTVYCLSKNKNKIQLYPKYLLDYGKYAIPSKLFDKGFEDVTGLEQALKKEGCVYDVYRYFETNNYIFFSFKRKTTAYHYFYSKKTKQVKIVDKLIIPFKGFVYKRALKFNDLPRAVEDNIWYFIKEPVDYINEMKKIKKHLGKDKWEKFKQENKEYYEFVSGLSVMDNPIIVKRKINPQLFN
ncbi:MAG: 6-bladed beta-propeller [Bacteroidales bacterium]